MEIGKYKELNYGIIKGNNMVLLIKVGSNGTLLGYNNKYLNIANTINAKYNATVIICSNPQALEPVYNMNLTLELVTNILKEKSPKIYYMGHSAGATLGAWYGYKYDSIKRMLLINGPLMYNLHKFKEGLKEFNGEKIELVYGQKDQSIMYTELLTSLLTTNKKLNILKNDDHHLSLHKDTFLNLVLYHLFK